MAYTTVENVELRLKGWATVNNVPEEFGTTQLDEALVELLISRADAQIDGCLSDRYSLPLVSPATLAIVAGISEELVLCKLIGQLYAGSEPSEGGGYGAMLCNSANRALNGLKTADFEGETEKSVVRGVTSAGQRNAPSVYSDRPVQKIDQVRW